MQDERKKGLFKSMEGLSLTEQMDLLESARADLAVKMKIHASKLTNGSQGERVVCNKLGLKWNSEAMHGTDAWDKESRACEIKCFSASAVRANISYDIPKKLKEETALQRANRVRTHFIETAPGGHFWAELSHGNTHYVRHWHIPSVPFANAIHAWCLANPGRSELNLGGAFCRTCKLPHRVVEIASRLANPLAHPRVHTLPERVKGNCKK